MELLYRQRQDVWWWGEGKPSAQLNIDFFLFTEGKSIKN